MLKNLNGTSDIITCDSDQVHYMLQRLMQFLSMDTRHVNSKAIV